MNLKGMILAALGHRQREWLRHYFLARQVADGQPIREKEIELIRQLVAAGDHVADIGANVGQFTRELSKLVAAEGRVYSFEPVANNYRILETVISRAKLANVTPFKVALGNSSGDRSMVIPSTEGFTGYYLAHFDEDGGEAGQRQKVTTTTLDELYARQTIAALSFVKCDVEGAELDVLRGGTDLIQALKPSFMIEVSKSTSAACFAFFRELQYRAYVYDGTPHQTDGYRDGEFSNYFFMHPTSQAMTRVPSLRV